VAPNSAFKVGEKVIINVNPWGPKTKYRALDGQVELVVKEGNSVNYKVVVEGLPPATFKEDELLKFDEVEELEGGGSRKRSKKRSRKRSTNKSRKRSTNKSRKRPRKRSLKKRKSVKRRR